MLDATSTPDVQYHVTVFPERHEIEVKVRLVGPFARGRIRLEIPTWVPGDYDFAPMARDLFDIRARRTDSGVALEVSRDGWQAFHVDGCDGDVEVTYRAFAYEIDYAEPCGIVDGEYAILLGARYLHCPLHLGACTVTYDVPEAWTGTLHHPSGAERLSATTWRYPSFEILLDTPVIMGHLTTLTEDVRGTKFHFVFVDRGVGFDACAPGFVAKVSAAAGTFFDAFGAFPFEDYTFVLSLNPAAPWGLEHLASSMCGLGPDVFTDPDQYATGVRVCAHELFHAWNVRRLRPAPLGDLEHHLTSGCFTEGLWMAEGFTRYYEFLSCARVGVYSPEQLFGNLIGYLEHLTVTPSYRRVSGADSSLATYLNHTDKYPGRTSNCIDYYDKGMLIAFGVDATLRLAPGGQSLDTAFRAFYERFAGFGPGHAGYTTGDVISFFGAILPAAGALIEAAVEHPGGLTTESLLTALGMEVKHDTVHRLGLVFLDDGAPTIYDVLDDSPAGRSGVAPGDVITRVNGFGYTKAALAWAAGHAFPVTLEVTRGHRTLSFTASPETGQKISALLWNGDEAQARRISAWLGRDVPLSKGQDLKGDFYENFHGIETVL